MPRRKVIGSYGMNLEFWKLKAIAGIGNKGIGLYGVFNKSHQTNRSITNDNGSAENFRNTRPKT
jgi:hypothetical protein